MPNNIELNIPKSAAARAHKSVLNHLLIQFKLGELNTEQTVQAIEHWREAIALPPPDTKVRAVLSGEMIEAGARSIAPEVWGADLGAFGHLDSLNRRGHELCKLSVRAQAEACLLAALSTPHGEGEVDAVLPCDVHLPPNTFIRKGCNISTLLLALNVRNGRASDDTTFATPSPTLDPDTMEACAKIADKGAAEMDALKDHDLVCEHEESSRAASIAARAIREVAAGIRALLATPAPSGNAEAVAWQKRNSGNNWTHINDSSRDNLEALLKDGWEIRALGVITTPTSGNAEAVAWQKRNSGNNWTHINDSSRDNLEALLKDGWEIRALGVITTPTSVNAEAVAWQFRFVLATGGWTDWIFMSNPEATRNPKYEYRPLYATTTSAQEADRGTADGVSK